MLQQLRLLALSGLLGALGAVFYDMLRAVRLLRRDSRPLTHLLDGLYAALLLLAVSVFALRLGEGELRLYMLLGIVLGAVLYFLLPSALLRPVWDFWTAAAAETARLLRLPFSLCLGLIKKLCKTAKKVFLFLRKYAKIKNYKWEFVLLRRHADTEGGSRHREKGDKRQKRA